MVTIALPPPQPAIVRGYEGLAQGLEGRYVEDQVEIVLRHWNEPAEMVLGELAEVDEFAYRSVPLKKGFTVKMKCRYRGRMKPRRLTLDD